MVRTDFDQHTGPLSPPSEHRGSTNSKKSARQPKVVFFVSESSIAYLWVVIILSIPSCNSWKLGWEQTRVRTDSLAVMTLTKSPQNSWGVRSPPEVRGDGFLNPASALLIQFVSREWKKRQYFCELPFSGATVSTKEPLPQYGSRSRAAVGTLSSSYRARPGRTTGGSSQSSSPQSRRSHWGGATAPGLPSPRGRGGGAVLTGLLRPRGGVEAGGEKFLPCSPRSSLYTQTHTHAPLPLQADEGHFWKLFSFHTQPSSDITSAGGRAGTAPPPEGRGELRRPPRTVSTAAGLGGERLCQRGDGETEKKEKEQKGKKKIYIYISKSWWAGGALFTTIRAGLPLACSAGCGCEQPPPCSAPRSGRAASTALGKRAAAMSRAASSPRGVRPLLRSFFLSPLLPPFFFLDAIWVQFACTTVTPDCFWQPNSP